MRLKFTSFLFSIIIVLSSQAAYATERSSQKAVEIPNSCEQYAIAKYLACLALYEDIEYCSEQAELANLLCQLAVIITTSS